MKELELLNTISIDISDTLIELQSFSDFMNDDIESLSSICGSTGNTNDLKAQKAEVVSLKLAHFQLNIANCLKKLQTLSDKLIKIADNMPA